MSILTNLGTKIGTEFKADRLRIATVEDTLPSKVDNTSAQALTTDTALSLSGNTLSLSRANGTTDSVDLSAYLDEDARAIASGVLDGATGIVTFTRDDATTFTLDLSDLLDDTNLVTSVNGAAGVVVLDTDDIAEGTSNLYYTDVRVQAVIDNNSAGFITDYTVTQTDVTQHQAALSVTESQISDLQAYVTEADQGTYLDFESAFNTALV